MIPSWLIIGSITTLVALGTFFIKPRPDLTWAKHLDRPKWLFFEPAIPFIWMIIFTCGALSAITLWESDPGSLKTWFLMGLYLLVEVLTVAYIPATLRTKSLTVGTLLGAAGVLLGIVLTFAVWLISTKAALLLIPYLIWTPIGTYTTREMIDLNPDAA